jgi:hypothetical protein
MHHHTKEAGGRWASASRFSLLPRLWLTTESARAVSPPTCSQPWQRLPAAVPRHSPKPPAGVHGTRRPRVTASSVGFHWLRAAPHSCPPWARQRAQTDAAPCLPHPPPRGLGGVPPAPLRSARGTASQRSGRRTGQRGSAGLPPPRAGLPGHIYHAGARAPANTPAAERSAALRVRKVAVLGLRLVPRLTLPARGAQLGFWPPPTLAPAPCSPPAASAASVRCAPRPRSRPPSRGRPQGKNPSPARRNESVAAGRAPCGQGQALRCAPGGSQARQP